MFVFLSFYRQFGFISYKALERNDNGAQKYIDNGVELYWSRVIRNALDASNRKELAVDVSDLAHRKHRCTHVLNNHLFWYLLILSNMSSVYIYKVAENNQIEEDTLCQMSITTNYHD